MDFEFNETERAIVDNATAFLENQLRADAARYRDHMVPKELMHALLKWGKPIGQHQLIQEMVADMATELDCARLLTYRAAWMVQRGMRADTQAAMAKYYASEAALRIASKAVQIHGALGLSRDLPVESHFRDARMISIPDGTSQLQQLIIARNILGLAAFGDAKH